MKEKRDLLFHPKKNAPLKSKSFFEVIHSLTVMFSGFRRKSRRMQALSRQKFYPLTPKLLCEDKLCIVCEGKCLVPLNENRQPGDHRYHQRLQINGTADLTKLCLPRKFALAGKSKSASLEERHKGPQDRTDVRILTLSSAKSLFPDFFPREEMVCYQEDCLIPLKLQADPVLNAWMHLFGHQIRK